MVASPPEMSRRRAPMVAGVALVLGLVVAGVGGLAVLEREGAGPESPAYRIALPPLPEAGAEAEVADAAAPPAEETAAEAPPDPVVEAAPEPAPEPAIPTLVVALGGLGWSEQLADLAHRALPPAVAFTLASDHPTLQERMGHWRQQGRDVILESPDGADAEVERLLTAHPASAGILVDGAALHTRRDPAPWPARHLDASLTDPAGFTAELRAVTEWARVEPPAVVVIELYPGLVPQLVAWLDRLQDGGYRLLRPIDLAEATP